MATATLPPQAYTKETLTKAFAWLQEQTEEVKDLATSPEVLVGLYHRAKRRTDFPNIDAQGFKKELQSLNTELKPKPQKTTEAPTPAKEPQTTAKEQQASNNRLSLDEKTQNCLNEVQKEMNLSSPEEALRLLVATGYKQIKPIL